MCNVEGGTQAWADAGLPVVRGQTAVSLERQVRIAAGLAALAAVAVLFATPLARSQVQGQIQPSFLPIGTAAAGASSTVWFHDPSSARVMACQATPAPAGPVIQCSVTRMPERP